MPEQERTVTVHLTESEAHAVVGAILGAKAVLDYAEVDTHAIRLARARLDEALRLGESANPSTCGEPEDHPDHLTD